MTTKKKADVSNRKRLEAHAKRTAQIAKADAKAHGEPPSTMAAIDAQVARTVRQMLKMKRTR